MKKSIRRERRLALRQDTAGSCFYCGCFLAWEGPAIPDGRDWLHVARRSLMCVEHKTPIIRGGKNARANMAPACAACNYKKRHYTLEEFRLLTGLRNRRMPHVFAGEMVGVERDMLVVASEASWRALVIYNFPGSAPLGGGIDARLARSERRVASEGERRRGFRL